MARVVWMLALALLTLSQASIVETRVVSEAELSGTVRSVSSDGRLLFYQHESPQTRTYRLRNLVDGKTTDLFAFPAAEDPNYEASALPSPDGKQLAYHLAGDLRVINIQDRSSRTVCSRLGEPPIFDWSPDGRFLLINVAEQLTQVAANDCTLKTVRKLPGGGYRYSPDGKYILFDSMIPNDRYKRDVFLMKSDGTGVTPLVTDQASDDAALGWLDGSRILFAGSRGGMTDVWMMQVVDGPGARAPVRLQADAGSVGLLGVASDGRVFLSKSGPGWATYLIDVDISGKAVGAPTPLRATTQVKPAAVWSPDGRKVAYLKRDPRPLAVGDRPGADGPAIAIQDVLSGQVSDYRLDEGWVPGDRLVWSPTGKTIVFEVYRPGKRQECLYALDVDAGKFTAVVDVEGMRAVWPGLTGDGKTLFYVRTPRKAVIARDLADGSERTVTTERLGEAHALSPDGRWFATRSPVDGRSGLSISVLSTSGGEWRVLVSGIDDDSIMANNRLTWTPDSQFILFPHQAGVWRVNRSGGPAEDVGIGMETITGLSVRPDGRRIAASGVIPSTSVVVWSNLPR